MSAVFHLLTGEAGDGAGGVGDYTMLLRDALEVAGVDARIWNVRERGFEPRLTEAVTRDGGCVLLQYVPNALGRRGANVGFCLWLRRLRHRGVDVRVMFHEPFLYFAPRPSFVARAVIQRAMAAILLRASRITYLSTSRWIDYLAPYAPAGHLFVPIAIPATVPSGAGPDRLERWRQRLSGGRLRPVGHFGTSGAHVRDELTPMAIDLLRRRSDVKLALIGRGTDALADALAASHPELASRISGTGRLDAEDVSAALQACDAALQPYPDGVTTRRTSIMAALANGVATVSSAGALTEPVWRTTGAVALAPSGDAAAHAASISRLLDDDGERGALAARGLATYRRHFAMERTVEALLEKRA